jgi:ERCC4-type nuclease
LKSGHDVEIRKIDEGDYAIEDSESSLVIERKSPQDLHSSLTSNHNRFIDVLLRAKLQGKRTYVFVECSKKDFLSKNYSGGWFRKKPTGRALAKMISTIEEKYQADFVFCDGRNDVEQKILETFSIWKKLAEIPK